MPPHRRWLYPPTRREITLLLFSLTIFVLSYNLEASLQLVGVHPAKLSSSYLSTIGLGTRDPGFDLDGRRPKEWRDELENLIFGDWAWDEGKVAGVERGNAGGAVGTAAIYNFDSSRVASRSAGREDHGIGVRRGVSAHEQFLRWGEEVPLAKALAHVPGYTILENVLVANGTLYLVTDDMASLPSLSAIASSAVGATQPPREVDWQIVSKDEANTKLGTFGGRIFGTTWLATDPSASQDPYTLYSLYRTHSTLAISSSPSVAESGTLSLKRDDEKEVFVPAPLRLIFPNVPTFSSPYIPPPDDDIKVHPPPRERSYNGIHPLIPKAVLPTVGVWYAEDWQDLTDMNAPWLFDRVVVADRGAADRDRDLWTRRWSVPSADVGSGHELRKRAEPDDGKPAWAAPFVGLRAKADWWTPVRAALLSYLRLPDGRWNDSNAGSTWSRKGKGGSRKPVVTYVSMQEEPVGAGARLYDEDHSALLAGLRKLQSEGVVGELHVVKGNGSVEVHGWEWAERMSAIARSNVVLGPYGYHLADSIFMAPPTQPHRDTPSTSTLSSDDESSQSLAPLLMEFFPPGTFVRDQEFAVRSLGMRYMAWWNDRKFTGNSLPPVIRPDGTLGPGQRLSVNADAIVQVIRDEIGRHSIP